jgi:hypothetical protein
LRSITRTTTINNQTPCHANRGRSIAHELGQLVAKRASTTSAT